MCQFYESVLAWQRTERDPKLLPVRDITLTNKLVTCVLSGPCDTKALCSFWLENYPANIRLEPNQLWHRPKLKEGILYIWLYIHSGYTFNCHILTGVTYIHLYFRSLWFFLFLFFLVCWRAWRWRSGSRESWSCYNKPPDAQLVQQVGRNTKNTNTNTRITGPTSGEIY